MIEDREPVAKENEMTPINIRKIQIIISPGL
jgi:hypothetical protein